MLITKILPQTSCYVLNQNAIKSSNINVKDKIQQASQKKEAPRSQFQHLDQGLQAQKSKEI